MMKLSYTSLILLLNLVIKVPWLLWIFNLKCKRNITNIINISLILIILVYLKYKDITLVQILYSRMLMHNIFYYDNVIMWLCYEIK
jgi:hypothetical protein